MPAPMLTAHKIVHPLLRFSVSEEHGKQPLLEIFALQTGQ
jgi:hypothetical protein